MYIIFINGLEVACRFSWIDCLNFINLYLGRAMLDSNEVLLKIEYQKYDYSVDKNII